MRFGWTEFGNLLGDMGFKKLPGKFTWTDFGNFFRWSEPKKLKVEKFSGGNFTWPYFGNLFGGFERRKVAFSISFNFSTTCMRRASAHGVLASAAC